MALVQVHLNQDVHIQGLGRIYSVVYHDNQIGKVLAVRELEMF